MAIVSDAYRDAEIEMGIPPVTEYGRTNQNPKGIGFWALVAEDFRTHERKLFEQGFWAIFVCRFGNWRMSQPKIIRAPCTLLHMILFKLVEIFCGISLWYTTKLGRRVRIWHHSGMVLGARAIGDDVQIRQNTTLGVGQTGRNAELPIICAGADIGAGACVAGAVVVGRDAKIGGNALVVTDVPEGAVVMGNPAQIVAGGAPKRTEKAEAASPAPAPAAPAPASEPQPVAQAVAPAEDETPMVAETIPMGRLALLGSANLDYLAMTLRDASRRFGVEIEPYVPEFGVAPMQLAAAFDDSPLQQAMQGELCATLIAERAEDVLGKAVSAPLGLAPEDAEAYLDDALTPLLRLIDGAARKLKGPVLVLSLAAFQPSTLGLADRRAARGRTALIARANEKLAETAAALPDVHLLDAEDMLAAVGRTAAAPGAFWHMGRVPFGEPFNAHLARRALGALLALRGRTARILVLDLDNTLWGGVLGEDGIEGVQLGGAYPGSAYRAFQEALRALTDRGLVLAIASKNDEDLALKMIGEHPEMALRLDDVVEHRIDWNEKASNIQDMLAEVGLGAASCLFIDDNPVERAKVRRALPEAIVPEFPDAPEKLVDWLLETPFLETLELNASDLKRSKQYKVRAKVNAAKRSVENIEEFYRELGMKLTFEPYGPMNQQRVLQLFVKTNQFNATTRRHDAAAVQRILEGGGEVYAVGYQDAQSDYELMGVLVLRPNAAMAADYGDDPAVQTGLRDGALWVDSFLLSCRILGRMVEQAILAWASQRAAETGAEVLIGQIIETPRNTPVRGVFCKSGFEAAPEGEGLWVRDLSGAGGPIAVPDYFEVEAQAPAETTAMAAPRAPRPAAPPPPPPSTVEAAPVLDAATEADLARVFRKLFRLAESVDLSTASMETVEQWDSLGHLKLAMEVERQVSVRLPGDEIGDIRTYRQLAEAVAAHRRIAGAAA